MGQTVLLVEDEAGLVVSLKTEFQFEAYTVLTAGDGLTALAIFEQQADQIDLIILDWMLPKLDGLGVLRRIRRKSQVPVIMLTARDYVGDKVAGLLGGADDYVTKPFEIEELLARMQVVLRRQVQPTPPTTTYVLADLTLDTDKRQVMRGTHHLQLTQREFQLLHVMFKAVGKTFTRDELLDEVWGVDFEGQPNIVDVYIRHLRHKVDAFPDQPKLIQTVRGVGYALMATD